MRGVGDAWDWPSLASDIGRAVGDALAPAPHLRVQGGCVGQCFRWAGSSGPLFVKLAPVHRTDTLDGEAAGLAELAKAATVRVPRVLAAGHTDVAAFLVLEWIDLHPLDRASAAQLGEQLARQHRVVAAEFGWHHDNTIGGTPQSNALSADWPAFFRDQRLRFQLELARLNGYDGRLQERGARLLEHVPDFFMVHPPAASLLHGDLWSGNVGADANGAPVIFDPAVYFGDRESDIAMTRLFGSFDSAFYDAYQSTWPLDSGAARRRDLYNLYHVLNHLNLFGRSYLEQAETMIARLLAACGRWPL